MAEEKTFRYHVTTGSFTLPVTSLLACVLWYFSREGGLQHWAGLIVVGVCAYIIAEWNNQNGLLRVRSRLMSATYLVLMAAFSFLHKWEVETLSTVCLLLSYVALFMAYQKPMAQGEVFHAFLFLGLGSLFFPPLLLLAPFFCSAMLIQLRVLNWRTFMAGVFGLLLPYWFYAAWTLWQDCWQQEVLRWTEFFHTPLLDYSSLGEEKLVSASVLAVLSLLSVAHFVRTSFNDKIRTRMLLYIIMVQEVVLVLMLVAWPAHFDTLMYLLVANSCPFIAHYYALARGRWMNAFFIVTTVLVAALAVMNNLNLWRLL